jgi:hypothetical protein
MSHQRHEYCTLSSILWVVLHCIALHFLGTITLHYLQNTHYLQWLKMYSFPFFLYISSPQDCVILNSKP